jgi:nitrate reductase NapAB chaperone NapD
MIITGSALLIEPGSAAEVLERLKRYPQITFHAESEAGTELVVTFETEHHRSLEDLCRELKSEIPDIIDISHVYVNFEEEIERMQAGEIDKDLLEKPQLDP